MMISNNAFIEEIERIKNEKNTSYMESIVIWCENNKQEIETAAYWVKRDTNMKAKLLEESIALRNIKKIK